MCLGKESSYYYSLKLMDLAFVCEIRATPSLPPLHIVLYFGCE